MVTPLTLEGCSVICCGRGICGAWLNLSYGSICWCNSRPRERFWRFEALEGCIKGPVCWQPPPIMSSLGHLSLLARAPGRCADSVNLCSHLSQWAGVLLLQTKAAFPQLKPRRDVMMQILPALPCAEFPLTPRCGGVNFFSREWAEQGWNIGSASFDSPQMTY